MKNKQLEKLFSQLCIALNMQNHNEKGNDGVNDSLLLDYDSIYGGYIIDIVHPNTSQTAFIFSNRKKYNEMVSLIQGLLYAYNNPIK